MPKASKPAARPATARGAKAASKPAKARKPVAPTPATPTLMGRPCEFTQEIADRICVQVGEGNSLRTICAADDMPGAATVFRWLAKIDDFREQYAQAREHQMNALAEEIIDISDNGVNDWMEKHHGDDVSWRENGEAINRSKLRVDTRKWLLSKLAPKKYGEKIGIEHSGTPIDDAQLDARIAASSAALIAAIGQATAGGAPGGSGGEAET